MILIRAQSLNLTVNAVTEQDKLNTMETKQFLAKFRGGVGDSVLAFEGSDLLGVGQRGRQGLDIQRPCVDMRINAEVGSGAVKEGLRLLPALPGLQEFRADGVQCPLA